MSTAYNSNQVPFAGFSVNVYRDQSSPTLLGVYLLESASPTPAAVTIDRPATDGGDNGWALVTGRTEGAAVFQLATSASPTLQNGDFFKTSKFSVTSGGVADPKYFVILSPSLAVGTTEYRKQSCTIREDKFPDGNVSAITEL